MPHNLIDQAIRFAAEAHAGQRRKEARNGFELPYITHPLEVLKTVWTWGAADETTAPQAKPSFLFGEMRCERKSRTW